MVKQKKKILILGGGFAGIECARILESKFMRDYDIDITLVSEDNFFLFTPMLPQIASGTIETRHIIISIRTLCTKIKFYEGEIRNIDPYGKIVNLMGTEEKRGITLRYDYLVLALGSETNFFGMKELEHYAYTLKTLNDAVVLRNRIIDMLEQAENESDPILRKSLLTFVIVGAGFAGIETAGELYDFLLDAEKHYPNTSKENVRVVVLEALPTILPGFNEKLANFALKKLTERGIEMKLNTKVSNFDGMEVIIERLSDKTQNTKQQSELQSIQTRTLIWTAGVTPVDVIRNSVFKAEKGRIIVNEFLEVPKFAGVFAIGDCCLTIDPVTKKPYPPAAQIAHEQAKVAARNLESLIKNKTKKRFEYRMKGQMAIIGKRTGIASIFGANVHGWLAWWLWRVIYLSKIPVFNKRLRIFMDWTADAVFSRDIARLKILKRETSKGYRELDEVDDVW